MKMLAHLTTAVCIILGCCCAAFLDSNQASTNRLGEVTIQPSAMGKTIENESASSSSSSSRTFLKEIFEKYGDNGVITLEGLEHLLENLGLGNLNFGGDHSISEHRPAVRNQSTFVNMHDPTHSHHTPPTNKLEDNGHHNHDHESKNEPEPKSKYGNFQNKSAALQAASQSISTNSQPVLLMREKCLNTTEILMKINANPDQPMISEDNFLSLCPIIVYELDQQHCRFEATNHNPNYHHDHDHHHTSENITQVGDPNKKEQSTEYVWFYSSVAVLIISVSGVLCVAIIPIIQRCFYQQLIQYLVALAIGSLTGDALLHLLPHAMTSVMGSGGHDHSDGSSEGHTQTVWVGLMALGGICVFFVAEQGLNALNTWKQKRDRKRPSSAEEEHVSDVEMKGNVGEKLSKHGYDSYGYRYEEIATDMVKSGEAYYDKSTEANGTNESEKNLLNKPCAVVPMLLASEKDDLEKDVASPLFISHAKFSDSSSEESSDVTHQSAHHGHGHSHSHEVPKTAMATAWMVIAGDGLHNFSDGMAIGAAFTNGLTGGLSTAIAVFCHELPHELGDFALLLKAGMSIKQGILYNCLSSILCFLGMLVGLAIGNIQSANAWVFAGAAGMFLYIALVDMVPELHNNSGESKGISKFVIQALGIGTGITIMCLIALYEEDLQRALDT